MTLLNVGAGRDRSTPTPYPDHDVVTLDADPAVSPDILCDARDLHKRESLSGKFAVIWCSHTLEHLPGHDVDQVLRGFAMVLQKHGLAHIKVPNILGAVRHADAHDLGIEDELYRTSAGDPVTLRDMLYGYGPDVQAGNERMAHRTGFTEESLIQHLNRSGFSLRSIAVNQFEIDVVGQCG